VSARRAAPPPSSGRGGTGARSSSGRAHAARIHAVVLAGGAGTRFWPLSRRARPKPLLRIDGGETLLGATLARARRVAGEERVWLVCGAEHARAMRRAAELPAERFLVEPRMRNTAAAVGLAAHRIMRSDPEAVLAVLPADHRVPDAGAFASALRRAARAASREPWLLTLGVRPTRPETGYGWIRLGAPLPGHAGLQRVARFVEKPPLDRARRYLRSGRYLWNAGIFVWAARTFLEELEAHAPAVARPLRPLATASRRGLARAVARAYARVPALPVDRAVLERSRRVGCLPVEFHWSDVGTWASLAEELGVGRGTSRVVGGEALLREADGNLVYADGRPVVLVGVEGLAVVDAGDALLVVDLKRSGEVREVVEALARRGRDDLL
jgi:mannose-1-phosphate guanylyltransferase